MNSSQKGSVGELKVEIRATEKGFIVSRPTTPSRYDLIVDDGTLKRVQVKYLEKLNATGSIQVDLRKFGGNKAAGINFSDVKTYSDKEIDALAVYCKETDQVYWIPSREFSGEATFCMKVTPCKNGQKKNTKSANSYVW